MSVTYIVLNLLLQNQRESKKMESGSYDEKSDLRAFSLRLLFCYMRIVIVQQKLACCGKAMNSFMC